jgi:anhydro-N-acetylmuramic acid kinase
LADYLLFRHARIGRIALNIGGIANISVIPASAARKDILAFDTGPGNMVIDALVSRLTEGRQTFDRDGRIARQADVHERMLASMLTDPYFKLRPPKTTGREQFGQEYASGLVATGVPLPDLIATATELAARSIAASITAYSGEARDVIVSGGGVHNVWLMRRLRGLLPGFSIVTSADHGINPDAKEAIAFAVLAHEFVRNRPGNLPSATGARRAVLLGRGTPVC